MITLSENEQVGRYTVEYLIKQSDFCGTYKVKGEDGTAFFMKLFDDKAAPEKVHTDGSITEIVLSRKVKHENLISYVDDGTLARDGESYPYLVSTFIRGSILSERLSQGRLFTPAEAKDIMAGVLMGIEYLHSIDLCHNDICPRNVILEENGDGRTVPRIIDLGHLSRRVSGSPGFPVDDLNLLYVAPEALAGFFQKEADVFSAGGLLYAMLTGKAPWECAFAEGDTYQDRKKKVRAARKEELDVRALKDAGADDKLVELIQGALSIDGGARISAGDFIGALAGKDYAPRKTGSGGSSTASEVKKKDDPATAATTAQVEIKPAKGGGFEDVAGMESLKAELTNRVIWVLRDREKAEKYRLTPPNGMILYGPPGCGKTFFAEKFAEETQFNFVLVNGSDLGSIYVHGTQGKIADLFKEAEKKAPTIICFDEFDSFVPSRSSHAAEHRPEEVNEFLGQLNNCAKKGIFVIGTTNRIDLIDPAVLRKGRMDLHIEIPAPDEKTRCKIFSIHLKGRPLADDVDPQELACLTDNYASADIAFIVNEAAMVAAMADEPICQAHLINAVKSNKSSLQPREEMRKIGF